MSKLVHDKERARKDVERIRGYEDERDESLYKPRWYF
jgi:hypothetical protein